MGKPTGFLEFKRELPPNHPAKKRVKNYHEFVEDLSEDTIKNQAARCMNCGIPFCHSNYGCPLGNLIPEFNDAVYNGNWKSAYQILNKTNNFPEFTGRICPAPCESSCVLGINEPPVTIENIEKNIIEQAFKNNWVEPVKTSPDDKSYQKIAVVGGGPAGMACAHQLIKAGHDVTLYERDKYIGGLLRYGIPDFKLEKTVIERRVKLLEKSGIHIVTECEVGIDISTEELLEEFDAIVLAIGSTVPRDLPIPGRDLKGIYFAMEFLKQNNKNVSGEYYEEEVISAKGKNVIVIGGGDTGSDCIGTSNRQGAKKVIQFELLDKPPTERTENMPWPMYPRLLKTTSSHEEGCERDWSIMTKEFFKKDGKLEGLKTVDVKWEKDEKGNPTKFETRAGSEKTYKADLVLLAMGFTNPEHKGLVDDLSLEKDQRGNIQTREFLTNNKKVFSCGDARRGQSLVVWAIHEGRECAAKVDSFLKKSKTTLKQRDVSLVGV